MLPLFWGSVPPSLFTHINLSLFAFCFYPLFYTSVHLDCEKREGTKIPSLIWNWTWTSPFPKSKSRFSQVLKDYKLWQNKKKCHKHFSNSWKVHNVQPQCESNYLLTKGDICWLKGCTVCKELGRFKPHTLTVVQCSKLLFSEFLFNH